MNQPRSDQKRFSPGRFLILSLLSGFLLVFWERSVLAAEGVLIDSVMAVVNHHSITKSEIDRELKPTFEKLHAAYQGKAYRQLIASLEYNVMMKKINERLELEEADRIGLSVTDDEVDRAINDIMQKNNITAKWQLENALASQGLTFRQYRHKLKKQLTVMKLVNQEVRSTVVISPDEVRDYFLKHRDNYRLPAHVTLADIFLSLPEGATPAQIAAIEKKGQHILRQIGRGDDFEMLAGSESQGPNAESGGLLGDLTKDQLLPELIGPAFSLPVGHTSGLIPTSRGFYIIKVLKREDQPYQKFDAIKQSILNKLTKKTTEKRIRLWLEKLRAHSYVAIYAKRNNGTGVTPGDILPR
ncbi:MAG: SurA N-terminal domain-containing protein [Nitrospirae bacterium]|nr:SurA N-terminal domain-containing protein [Nitrospirota bacterium]MCL5285311.1 SurA N-terminal domain-containing protein [Nitrospirota bacterium]